MGSVDVQRRSEADASIAITLGKPMPSLPTSATTEHHSYGGSGDVIVIRHLSEVAITTYECQRVRIPAELIKVFRNDQGRVETVNVWALPRPLPFFEAVDWFVRWLQNNDIAITPRLQEQINIWNSTPRPGNEAARNRPRQDLFVMDMTSTSALSVRWKPHPVRDWILVLGVGLTAEEMGKLRERDAASEDEQGKSNAL